MEPNLDNDSYGGSPSIDVVHKHIHKGREWHYSAYTANLNNGVVNAIGYRFAMDNYEAHLVYGLYAGADCTIELFEDTTRPPGGALTPVNRNRQKLHGVATFPPTDMTIFGTATFGAGADGTPLETIFVPGGSGGGGSSPGGTGSGRFEWVLRRDKLYLLKIVNVSTSSTNVGVFMDWYEVP